MSCSHCGVHLTPGARFCESFGMSVSIPSCDPAFLDSKQAGATDDSRKGSALSIFKIIY